jgi:hypothetical protein
VNSSEVCKNQRTWFDNVWFIFAFPWYCIDSHRDSLDTRVRVTLRLTASQYVLVSSPVCGHLTRYCFLFKCLGLEFVSSLWGALSDERPGLSFVSNLSVCTFTVAPGKKKNPPQFSVVRTLLGSIMRNVQTRVKPIIGVVIPESRLFYIAA